MIDTFRPLLISKPAASVAEDTEYAWSWARAARARSLTDHRQLARDRHPRETATRADSAQFRDHAPGRGKLLGS